MSKFRVTGHVRDIAAADWNRLAFAQGFSPLVSHAFFLALEASGSAVARTGWAGAHLLMEDATGGLNGLVPCYRKPHSMGEYVFDQGWAEAFERAGGNYYPKLQVSVPFTPVTGPRLFAATAEARAALANGLIALCDTLETSSVHMTFLPEADWQGLDPAIWSRRTDTQFHWINAGYTSFEHFLAALSSRKRKNISKERAAVREAGVTFEWVTGADITEAHWDAFFEFYCDTGARKWGRPYLTREFFSLVGQTMPSDILLIFAVRAGRRIAGALNFIGTDRLYGRNWGTIEPLPFLHFETCYYQAIEFAISRGLAVVEAGAQGEHKLARGYVPRTTFSLHHFANTGLARAVNDYLVYEREAVAQSQSELLRAQPFRAQGPEADF